MRVFIYRLGQSMKDGGERMGHIRMLGVHFLNWIAGPVIGLGLAIRNTAINCPIGDLR